MNLESRVRNLELDFNYYKRDIERQFLANQQHMDRGFEELRKAIRESSGTNNPELRDPKAWLLVVIGVFGGGLVFVLALWMATRGLA